MYNANGLFIICHCRLFLLQAVENGAIGLVVAVAGIVPALQLGDHLLQTRGLCMERGDVLRGQPLDLARVPRRVFL